MVNEMSQKSNGMKIPNKTGEVSSTPQVLGRDIWRFDSVGGPEKVAEECVGRPIGRLSGSALLPGMDGIGRPCDESGGDDLLLLRKGISKGDARGSIQHWCPIQRSQGRGEEAQGIRRGFGRILKRTGAF